MIIPDYDLAKKLYKAAKLPMPAYYAKQKRRVRPRRPRKKND